MGGLSIYLSNLIRNNYQDLYQDSLISEARLLSENAKDLIKAGNSQALIDMVDRYSQAIGTRITIIAPDGIVLAESSISTEGMANHLNRPEVQQALTEGIGSQLRYSNTLGVTMYYIAVPVRDGNVTLGVMRLALPLTKLESHMSRMISTAVMATAVTGLTAIFLAVLLTHYTIAPLRQLTNTILSMQQGNAVEVQPMDRPDEIGQLSKAFSQLAARLNAQIQELRNERGKLSAVLTQMTDGVLIVDSQGRVVLINPAAEAMFDVKAENVLGASLIEVVRQHEIVELWEKCQSSREQQSTTLETSPNRLFLQAITTPLLKAMPGNILMLFQDLTRLRRLEMVRRDFVSNVSHELRTPLASLKLIAETLSESALEDPPAAKRFLARMDGEIGNLTQLVQELLELSRIESGRVPLKRGPITPCNLINPAIERMQLQAERAGLRLQSDCAPSLPAIFADSQRIEQVMVNLLHNAIKFTPPGGEIKVTAYQENDVIVFSIRDTGVGIPLEELQRIFERFYKADRARTGGGTGLGLSIARHLIESHGGKIWAESQPGKGSVFFFSLPILK